MSVFLLPFIYDIPKVAFLIPSPLVAPAGTRNRFAKATSGMSCHGPVEALFSEIHHHILQVCVVQLTARGPG